MLRVQSDGNPASRSLDDLAVGDATLGAIALGGSPQSGIIASPIFAGVVSAWLVAPPPSITYLVRLRLLIKS